MRVGVIGLGSMGMGAALSLLRAGLQVTGCDPRAAARDEFIAAGGAAVAKASDLPAGMEALVVLVVNAAQTEAAVFGADGAAPRMAKGGVIISSATMAPDAARALAAKAEAAGLLYLDAPVSGGAVKARAGEMTVMGAGSEAAFAKAAPVLDAIATKVWRLGSEIGIGATVKAQALYDVVTSAAGNSWMFENRMARVLTGDDAPRSAVEIFVKDLGLVNDMARGLNFPVPLAAQAQQLFTAARAMGQGGADDGFVIRVWQAITGIDLPGDEKKS